LCADEHYSIIGDKEVHMNLTSGVPGNERG
jgi:hypothetical protein